MSLQIRRIEMLTYPRVFFNHTVTDSPKYYSLTTYQETVIRTMKWTMNAPLKTLRKSGSFIGLLQKVFQCSEPFYPLDPEVKIEIGVSDGYWLGPIKYKQRESEATILYLHGGGYIALSSLIGLSPLCYLLKTLRKLYNKHVRVLAIDYSLAPENPFPAGLDCAERTYRWLVKSGIAGSKNVFLFGDSAGGGLALALLQKLYPTTTNQVKDILPLGVILSSPWVELSCDSLSYFTNSKLDWLTIHQCHFAAEYYIFGKEGNPARKRNLQPPPQPKIRKDIIMDWLEKVEDNFDFVEFDGNSRFKRLSIELSKRLSNSNKRNNSIKAKKRGSKGAKFQKRSSRVRDSFNEGITLQTDDIDDIKSESSDIFKEFNLQPKEEEFKKNKFHESNTKKPNEKDPYKDPLISPLHIPHHILAKFPPLLIIYGGKEIFRDDIEKFTKKCIESKRDYTSFDDYDNNSLDGQNPDIVVEMDEDMVHDYPIFIDVFDGFYINKNTNSTISLNIPNTVPNSRRIPSSLITSSIYIS
ncbi:Alpha/Beta hydrolase protein [Glomus cerebriforme]|uniref:Alpha/Beta hydrolase protein n=1 Tax=Glomus cerebriforme TaxID=658196 RepID=A0A397SL93_9GLOM|nr:Alpha/Beta hydrolase protein [Glomus cerebriforme]